ncbi:DUF973 family protein [Saccharolobus caldissimus]|uniref:DUF973 family protein n=1 Tax=Saccharolobus caldissimus TaxID=1702097 RepID=UPI001E473739|nr:DUF973 family protein [Saccharolobus caldissimus]
MRNVRAYITEQAIGVRVARGAFSYSEHEFPFSQVYKVDVNRGFWDRVFGTGTMTIHLVSHERTGKYFFQVPHIRDYDYGKQLIYNMQLNWKSQVNRASNPGTNININLSGIPGMQPASPIANQPAQATDTEGSINSEGIAKITFYAAQPAKISGAMIANTNIVATPEDIWPNSINAGQNYLTIRFRNMQGLQKGYHIIIINTVEGKSITVPVKYE